MSPVTVLHYGMGTNSKGLLCKLVERGERPDLILSALVDEKPETIQDALVTSDWAESKGFPRITFVKYTTKDGVELTLEQDCLNRGSLPGIAFGFKSCSERWKIRPQNKFLKTWAPAVEAWARGERVVKLVGFDAGESHRAKDFTDDRFIVRYPLIEWDMDRDDCIEAIRRAGLRQPGKSACFYCPSSKKWEVSALQKEHPDLYERACEMERRAKPNVSVAGLGRTFAWADVPIRAELVKEEPVQLELPCGCFDG